MKDGYIYIMASVTRTIYIGVTNSLQSRVWQHQHGDTAGFTKRHDIKRLVYWEHYNDIRDAIAREKQLKGWRRSKKNGLIESMNRDWRDLTAELFEQRPVSIVDSETSQTQRVESGHAHTQAHDFQHGHPERSVAESKDRGPGGTRDTRSFDKLRMTAFVRVGAGESLSAFASA
ncbi:MAG: GIY-YIG nuclease family protein [Verrucomicrobiaceae bacterium]|nr:GIY-YIG nuclease family protein [Verrucomicrobiaceae bacterium]